MLKGKRKYLLLLVVVVVVVLVYQYAKHDRGIRAEWGNLLNRLEGKTLNREFTAKIKSGNLSTDYELEQALKDIDSMKLNTVNIPVVVQVENLRSSSMVLDDYSMSKARHLIKRLRGKKINFILEPYPWINKGQNYETDWNPDDVNEFFINWSRTIQRLIDEVAIPERVDALCIASNLTHLEKYEEQWTDIINLARKDYRGLITYKTNWWYSARWDKDTSELRDKKFQNKIFSMVDYISIAAYFELSEKPENSVEDLMKYLHATAIFNRKQDIVGELEYFHSLWGKKIFFGELGFPRRNYAAKQPWNPSPSEIVNDGEQARCFEAYLKTFNQDWFLGFSLFAIGNYSVDKHYYPSTETVSVIREWDGTF